MTDDESLGDVFAVDGGEDESDESIDDVFGSPDTKEPDVKSESSIAGGECRVDAETVESIVREAAESSKLDIDLYPVNDDTNWMFEHDGTQHVVLTRRARAPIDIKWRAASAVDHLEAVAERARESE